jgi:succinyl-CoA synthetase beta subunit
MDLHEFQSKRIFSSYGVPIPNGEVATTAAEAKAITRDLGGRAVIKSQVLSGGRGKAGGIKVVNSPEEAEEVAKQLMSMSIRGLPVRKVLVDELADIASEIYLGITNDRAACMPVMMASSEGGVEIEEVARVTPEKIIRVHINPLTGLQGYQARDLAAGIDLPRELWRDFHKIASSLWNAYKENDATLAEINPLIITGEGKLLGLDGKMSIDDNALYRHPVISDMRDLDVETQVETEARAHGVAYITLDGNIGCMVNGAGLAMTTMDIIKLYGGEPANFLDIGGGASAERVSAAFRMILSDQKVEAILINIFGGITRCDIVAQGILTAMKEVEINVPMVVRLAGNNAEEGRAMLADADMITAETLTEAAEKAVAAAKGA